tara:strand:+ start:342 stop:668 length:327 start_codon:yes stop_codon:yes gene_type:complete
MSQCKCGNIIPQGRVDLGYTECVQCSTVEQYGCAPITFHKTGNSIQIMSSQDAARIAKLTRRKGYGTMLGVFLALVTLSSCTKTQAECQPYTWPINGNEYVTPCSETN